MAIMGETPAAIEEQRGDFFVGPTGELLDERILQHEDVRVPRLKCHITNALLCWPAHELEPATFRQAIACCRPRLERELAAVKPEVVLTYGKWAFYSATGLAKSLGAYVGAPVRGVEGLPYTILPTWHPAMLFRDQWDYLPVLRIHTLRAWQLANGQLPAWEWPKWIIDPCEEAEHALREMLTSCEPISVDIETMGVDPWSAPITCIGMATRDGAVSLPWHSYGNVRGIALARGRNAIATQCYNAILDILRSPRIEKVWQNGIYDRMCLRHHGVEVVGSHFDTLTAHMILAPGLPHDESFQCAVEFHAERWKEDFRAGKDAKGKDSWGKRDPHELRVYNSKDNIQQANLRERYRTRLSDFPRGHELMGQMTTLGAIADEMCWRGVTVDEKRRAHHDRELSNRIAFRKAELARLMQPLGLADFNPASGAHLRKLYLDVFQCKPMAYTDSGLPSFDAASLTAYFADDRPLVVEVTRQLLRLRKWSGLLSTHVRGLRVDGDGVAHPFWRPGGAISGRWASSNPNVLNIPKPQEERNAEGKKVTVHAGLRDMYVPHAPKHWIVEADYSQIELRIAALLAGDVPLLETFAAGADPHAANAWDLFYAPQPRPVPLTKASVLPGERTLAKNFVYLANYGGDAEKLWQTLLPDFPDYQLKVARKHLEAWFRAHPAIKRWQEAGLESARNLLYVEEPLSGRRRFFWSWPPKPTEVYNFPIQTAASEIINRAIVRVHERLKWPSEGIVFQYHDALVLSGPDPYRLATILQEELTKAVSLAGRSIEFPIDIEVGKSFGNLDHVSVDDLRPKPRRSARTTSPATKRAVSATAVSGGAKKRSPQACGGKRV